MNGRTKCIVILSTKSAGSSALQELFCRFGGARHVERTRHSEFETLYWTKAASVLGIPQIRLPDSEVPIPAARALLELREFLLLNTNGFDPPDDQDSLVFDGWRALCAAHAPIFVEKSPHHLHQWGCLKLLLDAMERMPEIDFRFVGLIRNPMDVLYSAWSRWRTPPELLEQHWRIAHENLGRLRDALPGPELTTVRYEDFSADLATATRLFASLGLVHRQPGAESFIHGGSRLQWKNDRKFGFQLSPSVTALALELGYQQEQLLNRGSLSWPVRRRVARLTYKLGRTARRQLRRVAV